MLILGFDASAVAGSCALCEISGEKITLISESFVNTKLTHSQTLLPMTENMLKSVGINISNVELIAVTAGPGSFTGIRIGVSAAKGLSYALDIPCAGVSTLHSLAFNSLGTEGIVCAVMDARCSQFYNALFSVKGSNVTRITPDRAVSADELRSELINNYGGCKITYVGDGAELAYNTLNDVRAELAPVGTRFQRASSVCLAASQYDQISARKLLPVYLRLPQAERERLAKINKE